MATTHMVNIIHGNSPAYLNFKGRHIIARLYKSTNWMATPSRKRKQKLIIGEGDDSVSTPKSAKKTPGKKTPGIKTPGKTLKKTPSKTPGKLPKIDLANSGGRVDGSCMTPTVKSLENTAQSRKKGITPKHNTATPSRKQQKKLIMDDDDSVSTPKSAKETPGKKTPRVKTPGKTLKKTPSKTPGKSTKTDLANGGGSVDGSCVTPTMKSVENTAQSLKKGITPKRNVLTSTEKINNTSTKKTPKSGIKHKKRLKVNESLHTGGDDVVQESVKTAPEAITAAFSWTPKFRLPTEESDSDSDDEDVNSEEVEREALERKSITHLEQLVCQSPHSSMVWLKYMAYYLERREIEQSRTIADRALVTIGHREEQERLNIWVGYMNLENNAGSETSLAGVVERALQSCDPIKIYMHLVDIYMTDKRYQDAENVYSKVCKKFSHMPEFWIGYGLCYFMQGNAEKARHTMQRAIKALPQTHHVLIIKRYARMEFNHGDKYIGSSMFENLLNTYGKRMDLWLSYIELMIKHETSLVRAIFERAIQKNFKPKVMKTVFRKYVEFEGKYGTEKSVIEVKEKAMEFVKGLARKEKNDE